MLGVDHKSGQMSDSKIFLEAQEIGSRWLPPTCTCRRCTALCFQTQLRPWNRAKGHRQGKGMGHLYELQSTTVLSLRNDRLAQPVCMSIPRRRQTVGAWEEERRNPLRV